MGANARRPGGVSPNPALRTGATRLPTVSDPGVDRILFAPRVLPPLRPDAAHDEGYAEWILRRAHEPLSPPPGAPRPGPPVPIAVLMAVDDPVADRLDRSLASMAAQTVRGWRLSVAVVGDGSPAVTEVLAR